MSGYTRRFHGEATERLIVSIPVQVVEQIDSLISCKHPARRNRSEFVRLAIAEKLKRDIATT